MDAVAPFCSFITEELESHTLVGFFRGLVVGPSASFHTLPAATGLVLYRRSSLLEDAANKTIHPCQEKCDLSLADVHTKAARNEIFSGS